MYKTGQELDAYIGRFPLIDEDWVANRDHVGDLQRLHEQKGIRQGSAM
jgi:hypothetical protein